MSNKKYRPKSSVNIKVGGFTLKTSIKSGHDYLIAETLVGNWRVVWRDDTSVYRLVLSALATDTDGGVKDYIHKWLSMVFIMSHTYPDGEFITDFDKALMGYVGRTSPDRPELSEDEMNELAANIHAADAAYNGDLDRAISASDEELARWRAEHPDE